MAKRLPLELKCELFSWLKMEKQRRLITKLSREIYFMERKNVKRMWMKLKAHKVSYSHSVFTGVNRKPIYPNNLMIFYFNIIFFRNWSKLFFTIFIIIIFLNNILNCIYKYCNFFYRKSCARQNWKKGPARFTQQNR